MDKNKNAFKGDVTVMFARLFNEQYSKNVFFLHQIVITGALVKLFYQIPSTITIFFFKFIFKK